MSHLRLDPGKPLPDQVNDALRRLTHHLGQGVSGESPDFDQAIHASRTSLKKLRALLRLLRPTLPDEAFREQDQQVRDFGRQLCGVRDAAVMLATFREIHDEAAAYLKQAATASIEHALDRHYREALEAQDSARLRDRLTPQFRRLEQALHALKPAGFDQARMIDAVEQVYRDGLHGYHSAQIDANDEKSHAWRKDVKYLWYQLLLFAAPRRKRIKHFCKKLDRLGEALGRAHDLFVLSEYLHRHGLLHDPVHEAIMQGLIAGRRHGLVDDALRQAKDIYRMKPAKFADWLSQSLAAD